MQLHGLPELDWLDNVGDATVEHGMLTMHTAPKTDWFNDPAGPTRVANAPALMCRVRGDFQLEATINVAFAATFDAGVLFVHQTTIWRCYCASFNIVVLHAAHSLNYHLVALLCIFQ